MAYQIDISGYIGTDDFSFLGGDSCFGLSTLNALLAEMPQDETEIDVYINSGGGLVSEGFAIYDKLMSLSQTVNTVVLGTCGSIATVIAQAGKKGTRKMYENSEYFIHNPYWTPSAPDGFESVDLIKIADELKKSETKILGLYVSATGASEESLRAKMEQAVSLTSAEAKELGFIDDVITTTLTNQITYRIAAYAGNYINTFKNNNEMATLQEMFKTFEDKFLGKLDKIENRQRGTINNAMVTTTKGEPVYYEGELNIGTKLYTDEAMTAPLADGDYTIGENLHVVKDGAVVEVKEPTMDDKDTEIANLKSQLEALSAEKDAAISAKVSAENEVAIANQAVAEAKVEFQNFRNSLFTGGKLKPELVQNFDRGINDAPKNTLAETIALQKAKQEAKKK